MSAQQPTYEELVASVTTLKKELDIVKVAAKKGMDDNDDDDKLDASFKQAMDEMKEKDKEHKAMDDEKKEVKNAFKIAMDEEDPKKKHDAMKKAMDMKEEHDKKARKAMDEPDPKTEKKDPERDAKVAHLEDKYKEPIVEKILLATQAINPTNLESVRKELTASTLEQVEKKWTELQPFVAAIGLDVKVANAGITGMIPFQASQVIGEAPKSTDILTASVDDIDFDNIPTSKIMEMYK